LRYFLDTEFYEQPGSIELISIGIVADEDPEAATIAPYYAETHFDWARLQRSGNSTLDWLKVNVRPHLKGGSFLKTTPQIRQDLLDIFANDKEIEFWGYYADYDWVVFCWIFGRMVDLPKHFPKFCWDIKQVAATLGNPPLPKQEEEGEHNALADAVWNRQAYHYLVETYWRRIGGTGDPGGGS
jgi:3'-5' exoribonuclease-like protein